MKVFDFGSNWEAFSAKRLDPGKLSAAARSIQLLLKKETLSGLSFLDIGCGAGVFSIAAHHLGASRVIGTDINPSCISVSEQNRDRLAAGAPIRFRQASVLDVESMRPLGSFDIVYAWGSLHHTGAMWDAIRAAAERVSPEGMLALAIYNEHLTSPAWRRIKWSYNRLPRFGKQMMAVLFYGIIYTAKFLVTRRNPLEKERGMDFWFDVVDWIGGYPYEYASRPKVQEFLKPLGFELIQSVPAQVPTGCNEFVFVRPKAVARPDRLNGEQPL